MKIGVFDSGVGGKHIANFIQASRPELEVVYRNDREHVPYGSRSMDQVKGFVVPILMSMADAGCEIIVIACNTVTTNLIEGLRKTIKVPLIGMEPMVKPAAALTKTGHIVVCATPATLASKRYNFLKREFASDYLFSEPDCSDWSYLIEKNLMNVKVIRDRLLPPLENGADVVVLGCTHYHWIKEDIERLCRGRAVVIQPEEAILRRLDSEIESSLF